MSERASLADRRANALQGEMEEARSLLDSAERGKRQTEAELNEARGAVNEMTTINTRAGAEKRSLEAAVHTMQAEIDDMLHQAKNSEEKAKKAMVDAARLAGWFIFFCPNTLEQHPTANDLSLTCNHKTTICKILIYLL